MRSIPGAGLPAALVPFLLGAACAGDGTAARETTIIGGQPDPGLDPAVVLIRAQDADGRRAFTCTGTLISPRVVLTAAHCADGSLGAVAYQVDFADRWDPSTDELTGALDGVTRLAAKVFLHPAWESGPTVGDDLALLLIDHDAPATVTPAAVSRYRTTAAWTGRPVRLVGFGLTAAGDESTIGEKREGRTTLGVVTEDLLVTEGAVEACRGDSGGPLLVTIEGREVIAGITSLSASDACESAGYTRIDRQLQHIDGFLGANDPTAPGGCGADGACGTGCAGVDPDCPCIGDGRCTDACGDPDLDPDCPLHCAADGTCADGCPVADVDCAGADDGGGCAVGAAAPGAGDAGLVLLLLSAGRWRRARRAGPA